jgi:hypothetical protein
MIVSTSNFCLFTVYLPAQAVVWSNYTSCNLGVVVVLAVSFLQELTVNHTHIERERQICSIEYIHNVCKMKLIVLLKCEVIELKRWKRVAKGA